MKSLSFRQLLIVLCTVGIAGSLFTGGAGLLAQLRQTQAMEQQIIAATALRNSVEIDMMHDALRADVYEANLALATNNGSARNAVLQSVEEHATKFARLVNATEKLPVGEDITHAIAAVKPSVMAYIQCGRELTALTFSDADAARRKRPEFDALFKKLEKDLEETSDTVSASIAKSQQSMEKELRYYRILSLAALTISIVLLLATGLTIIRRVFNQLGGDPAYARNIVNRVRAGELDVSIQFDPSKSDSLLAAVENMRHALKDNIDRISTTARESSRIRSALDVCKTNVMLADENLQIIYLNESVQQMMRAAEQDLRKEIPEFHADKLLGANFSIFHKNSAHQRTFFTSLQKPHSSQVNIGGRIFDLTATPVFDEVSVRTGTVVEWQDMTQTVANRDKELRLANENARIRQALDNVATNTMIADADNNIIYLNKSVQQMMHSNERTLQTALPRFNASTLIGTSIDTFHRDPSHQRNLLATLTTTYRSEVKIAGLTFGLTVNPIVDTDGKRIGNVVEWTDRTQEVAIEEEIKNLVAAAAQGDFSHKMNLAGKQGFFLVLGEILNELVSSTQSVVNDVLRIFSALANGDLSQRVEQNYRGAFLTLKQDANTSNDKLNEVVNAILGATDTITTGAREIAAGNSDLSQRTEEQASSLEQTAASMEQMTGSVRQAATNAQRANELAQDARGRAAAGADVMNNAITAMQSISKSSKDIADIIGVIDEIAFQTNLLALNAAVEAARAGDQGRGFAVVAGEVRNLAQRSASAAKQISTLIKDSVDKVSQGTDLVNRSGSSLREIAAAVEQVSGMMQEIAASAREQSSGIEQVNTAIAQMDEITQQNAALVEQATAASEHMSQQAMQMADVVGFFRSSAVHAAAPAKAHKAAANPKAATPRTPVNAKTTKAKGRMPATKRSGSPTGTSHGKDQEWEEF